jgi:DNA gyrase subunit A
MAKDGMVTERNLLVFAKELTYEYGTHTIENRALPDYRDGMKPVHRRVLWAMNELNLRYNGPYVKAARVVGDTMGKYHPHGDRAIYDAMVGMANLSVPLVDGEGNWGGLTDDAAAMRYTEARMTKYAQETMLSPNYMAVTPMVDNYDGKDKEPLYLPALLPNLLLNGTYGIAVGITSVMPPMRLEPLMPLIDAYIGGQEITNKAFKKAVRFNYPYGGVYGGDKDMLDHWITEGYGSLMFRPEYTIDEDTRTITFTKVVPYFNWESAVKRLANLKNVSGFDDLVSKADRDKDAKASRFVVRMKSTVPREDLDDALGPVVNVFSNSVRMATNITMRHSFNRVEFRALTLANLLSLWIDYRIDLEKRTQQYIIGVLDGKISYQKLMLLAVDNRANILKALDSKTPDKVLIDKLRITQEQADMILSLQVRSLSRMNGEQISDTITKLGADRKQSISYRDKPGPKIISDMNGSLKLLTA